MIEAKNKPCFSLIMPILNEGNRIIPTIATLGLTINYPFELIIIYDNDSDITLPVIYELKKHFNFTYLLLKFII